MRGLSIKYVFLITVDSLRYDYSKKYMTFMNNFFEKHGTIYNKVYTHGPGTPASFPAILTSSYPLMYKGYPYITRQRKLLSEVLKSNGFITIGIAPNPYLSRFFGYSRGYSIYLDEFNLFSWNSKKDISKKTLKRIFKTVLGNDKADVVKYLKHFALFGNPITISANKLTKISLEILKRTIKKTRGKKKLFMWIHYMNVHSPYFPSLKHMIKNNINIYDIIITNMKKIKNDINDKIIQNLRKLYASCVQDTDTAIKTFIDHLNDYNILDESLIIITSDHGEELYETGSFGHPPKLSELILRVPLYVYPRMDKKEINTLKGLIDLSPSILAITKIYKKISSWWGKPTLFSETENKYIIAESGHTDQSSYISREHFQYAIITERYKLIYKPYNGVVRLYDLSKSYMEQSLSLSANNDIVKELLNIIKNHIKDVLRTNIKVVFRQL